MPVLDIGFSQAKMASIAPKMAATLAVKRSSLALINGDDAEARTMHLAQQSLKKRRLLPLPSTTSPTHSSQTVAHDGPPSPRSSETDDSGDLTNLNWLQDANLLKNFLSDPLDAGKSNGSNSADTELASAPAGSGEQQVIATRRPPKSVHRKPPYSYSALIFMAIESSPTKSMLVREIYSWITTNFPYFETAPSGWKNTIRHTLSLRKCFKKIDKGYAASEQSGDNDSDSGDVKGGYWHVDRDYRPGLQQLVERSRQSILPKVVVRKGVWDCLWSSGPAKLDSSSQSSVSETPKLVALSGQRFIKVPVIRSFSRHRTKPQAQGTGKVAAPMWAPKATWEKAAEAYQLELTLNKLCSGLSNGRAMPTAVPSQRRNRNSVSVISVNQAPKVYAPVPKVTGGKHSPVLPQLNHTLASTHPAHLIRNGPFTKVHLATDRQQHKVSTFPNAHCPHIVSTGRVTSNGTVTAANGHRAMVQANLASIKSENEDDDDVLIRDGAQALLNFASGAFQLNRLIKQED